MTTTEVRYAGFWIRFCATMIDVFFFTLILLILLFTYYGADQALNYFIQLAQATLQPAQGVVVHKMGAFHIFVEYILPIIVVLFFWKYRSATPGKMILGLKIVDSTTLNEKLSVKQMIIRYFAYLIPALPCGIGFLLIGADPKKQGWHDKISKTFVIRK